MAGTIRAAQVLRGVRIGEAEAVWYDPQRWAAFVDGFGRVEATTGDWPRAGGQVAWSSPVGGRGRVVERAAAYEPRVGQTAEVDDPALSATQRVEFSAGEDGCRIAVELTYELKRPGFGGPLTDVLFVRPRLRESLRRTLQRFARELTAER